MFGPQAKAQQQSHNIHWLTATIFTGSQLLMAVKKHRLQSNGANYIDWNPGISLKSPYNAVPHGGQIIVHSTSQHSTTSDHCVLLHSTTSDHRAFHQLTQYHIRSSCIPPINSTTSDHRAFHQLTQYHIRSSCIPPVNTVPHQIIVHSTSQHSHIVHSTSQHTNTWRSDQSIVQSAQYLMADI